MTRSASQTARRQIRGGKIHRARPLTIFQAGAAADKTRGLARELPAPDRQPDGTAEQAHADDGDLPKMHVGSIADGGWRMEDGNDADA